MPDLAVTHTFANGTPADGTQVNQNFDDVEAAFNASIASLLADSGQTAGKLVIVNNTGAPAYQAMSGDATIASDGTLTIGNDKVSEEKITGGLADKLGVSEVSTVRRGKSIIATEESRTNVAYGTLTTPDQVQNVVLPTDGLIVVAFHGLFKSSVSGAGRAAIFVGATQLKRGEDTAAAPVVQESDTSGTSYNNLASHGGGLGSQASPGDASVVTTGQIVGVADTNDNDPLVGVDGGACLVFAAAGTYTVSVQFKATSGSVTAKERKLWVWTMGF